MPQQSDEALLPCPSFPFTAEKLVEPLKLLLAVRMYSMSLAMYWTKTGLIFAVTMRGLGLELCCWGQDPNLTSLPERIERDSLSVTFWKKRHYFPVVGKCSRLRHCLSLFFQCPGLGKHFPWNHPNFVHFFNRHFCCYCSFSYLVAVPSELFLSRPLPFVSHQRVQGSSLWFKNGFPKYNSHLKEWSDIGETVPKPRHIHKKESMYSLLHFSILLLFLFFVVAMHSTENSKNRSHSMWLNIPWGDYIDCTWGQTD